MSGHSLNSPSSFSRRIGCPGSANMEKDIPSTSSSFADEGTAAHELGETCLLKGDNPSDYMGEVIVVEKDGSAGGKFTVDAEMVSAVEVYVEHCRPLMGRHMVEYKFDLPFLGVGEKGTSDFTALHSRILHVVDYKHGKGVPVDAIGNIQGLCYGMGASAHFQNDDWDTLRITIVQPRAYHDDGPVRSWDVPRDEIFEYMLNFAAAAKATEDPNAPLKVGKWCRFCKAKVGCPAQLKNATDTMEIDFAEETSKPVPVGLLTDEQILDIVFNKLSIIEQWCASLKDYAQKKAEAGEPIKGSKLVYTRAVRMWKDKQQAEEVLKAKFGEKIYEKEFVSAPKFEKIIGKKEFKEVAFLVDKISTGVTLVPESDPRESARNTVENEFSDFT
jgi:hypothetical protein